MTYGTPEYWQRQAESLGRENANLRNQVNHYAEAWNVAERRLTELGETTGPTAAWARHLAERDALAAAVERVRALHVAARFSGATRWVCSECCIDWPCPTSRALNGPDA